MFEDDKTSQRINSLHSRGSRVPSRTFSGTSGEAIPIDSIIGPDGIPIGVQDRRILLQQAQRVSGEEGSRWYERIMLHKYPLSLAWLTVLTTIGAILQGIH